MQDGIAVAFDRVDDFMAVQGPRPPMDAVLNLWSAVGIELPERTVIRERLSEHAWEESAGPMLLGLLLGLLAAAEEPDLGALSVAH